MRPENECDGEVGREGGILSMQKGLKGERAKPMETVSLVNGS